MTTEKSPSYNRAPSDELKNLLRPGGFLAPLLDLPSRNDFVHFRPKDHVKIYRGLTSLVDLHFKKRDNQVTLTAHETYTEQECSGALFREWRIEEHGFEGALYEYLNKVVVNEERWTKGEGEVQRRWARVAEYRYDLWKFHPWTPFDREIVLKEQKPRKEIDQIAVDPKGNLVILELKDSGGDIKDAPYQILEYTHEWCDALVRSEVRDQMQKLIDVRKELGLMPDNVPLLTGGIRAAICFGNYRHSDPPRPTEEPPTSGYKRLYYENLDDANKHLDDANKRLPRGVPPIETWKLDEKGPYQIVRSTPSSTTG